MHLGSVHTTHAFVGGSKLKRMAIADADRKRLDYMTERKNPVVWYTVEGVIKDQKDMILYKVLPEFLNNSRYTSAQILWIP